MREFPTIIRIAGQQPQMPIAYIFALHYVETALISPYVFHQVARELIAEFLEIVYILPQDLAELR